MELVDCPHCGMRVAVRSDGICPSCRKSTFDPANETSEVSVDSPSDSTPGNGLARTHRNPSNRPHGIFNVPNMYQLVLGAIVTLVVCSHLIANVGYDVRALFFTCIVGIPVAFLFLMFNNPAEKKSGDWGLVLAFPFCSVLWPVLLIVLAIGRPWNQQKWINRHQVK